MRILSTNTPASIRRYWHEDRATGDVTIASAQDVEQIVEDTKGVHRQFDERSNWKGDMHRVATIPLTIYFDLYRKGIVQDQVAFKRWMNDPDNAVFRTRPGRV
jgi:hypothetical protein